MNDHPPQQPPLLHVTFSAPYSSPDLLSSTLLDTHQHPGPENDDILPQHYPPLPVAFPQPLITVPSQHAPLQSYETAPQFSPERITHLLDQPEHGPTQSPQPPAPPPNVDTQLALIPLVDVEKQKPPSKPMTKKDLRVGPRTKYLPCIGCDAVFDRPSALKLHMLSHTGEKPHECPRCHRRFSVPSNMRRHRATCGIARSRRSFVNITMPPFNNNTSSDDADRERAGRVDACGKYVLSPDEHPDGDPSGCSPDSNAHRRPAHHKSQASSTSRNAVASDQQQFMVRWVEPMEYPNAPTPPEKTHNQPTSNSRRRFSTFVMSSPAAAQTSGADSPDRKFQIYRPQLVDDPVPTNELPPLGSGCIPGNGSHQPASTTEMSSPDPCLPSFSSPVPQKCEQNHYKSREDADLDDLVSPHSLTSAATLSSVSSASSLCQLHQDSVDFLPTTLQEFGTSEKATLDQVVCEEPHLADNPAQHSVAPVQINSHIESSSTMDHGHVDGQPTFTEGQRPPLYQQTTGRLVELSQNAVAVFYPSSLPSVSDEQTSGPQNVDALPRVRKRSRGNSPHEASQSLSTGAISSSFPVSPRQGDEQNVSDNNAIQGIVSHSRAGPSRDGNLDHSHGLVRLPVQQGINGGNSAWPPSSLWHCRNAHLLTSHGPFPWWDPQPGAQSGPSTLRSPVQHLQQSSPTGPSKELQFVHYAGQHEAHDTSLGVPISNDALSPSTASLLATTRRSTRGITVPLAPIRPRGSDNRGRTAKKSTRRNTLWLSAPKPPSGPLSLNAHTDWSESAHNMGATSPGAWTPPHLHHHHSPHRSSYSEELIPTTMQDPASHNARYNRYHSFVHLSHRQPFPHHSTPTPPTSRSSHMFSLATDTSEEDDSEESEWEERDSYAADVPRQPYNTKYWRERLPGPALLAGDLLERDPARARRWLLID